MSDQPAEVNKPEEDKQKDTMVGQIRSLSRVFWLAGWMELIERFAYFGVRNIIPLFMVAAFVEGGPQLDHIQKANIYGVWAVVQSFVPILSGGFADRYGCKVNIAMATLFKVLGYLVMAYTVQISEWLAGMPLAEARLQGKDQAYAVFFSGAMLLAFGTAIFKPGIGGLIATQLKGKVSAMGWALFYQMVNVGGFVGPLVAGYLRVLKWDYVFLICSGVVCLNFIPLFFFKEPLKVADEDKHKQPGPWVMLYNSIKGLLEPRLFFFTIAFAGFWLMYNQLFDILPNFIDDWVDSRAMAGALQSVFGGLVPTVHEGNLTQEWIINLNPLLISVGAFMVGYATSKIRSLTTIILGIIVSVIGIYCLGFTMNGWWILVCIAMFSLGEMMAGPTTSRYLMQIAPEGKKGLYIGYSGFANGIGWSIGSIVAGHLYQTGGDKVVLARNYLAEHASISTDAVMAAGKDSIAPLLEKGVTMDLWGAQNLLCQLYDKGMFALSSMVETIGTTRELVTEIPKGAVMPIFEQAAGVDAWGARELLWQTYSPYSMWTVFALIGLGSLIALMIYNHFVKKADEKEGHSFNVHGDRWVLTFLVPIVGIFAYFTWNAFATYREGLSVFAKGMTADKPVFPFALSLNAVFFVMMLVIALIQLSRGEKNSAKPIKVH